MHLIMKCQYSDKIYVSTKIIIFIAESCFSLVQAIITLLSSTYPTPQGRCFLRSLGPRLSIAENGTWDEFGSRDILHFIGEPIESCQIFKRSPKAPSKFEIIAGTKEIINPQILYVHPHSNSFMQSPPLFDSHYRFISTPGGLTLLK